MNVWKAGKTIRVSAAPFVLALLAGCANGYGDTVDPTALERPETDPSTLMQFHRDRGMALHLFAFNFAVDQSSKRVRGRYPLDPIDKALIEGELADEFAPVARAYDKYVGMHPLFSNELARLGLQMAGGGMEAISDPEVKAALIAFMPVYEKHFAPRHDAVAAALERNLRAQLDRHGTKVATELAAILGSEWGEDPIRIDIVPYATRAGAYTAGGLRHIVIGALDEEIQARGFEIVFHEASHTRPIGNRLRPAAQAALDAHGLEAPRFWHYLLFHASGEAVKTVMPADYVTYSEAVGLRSREDSKVYYDAIEAVWEKHTTIEDRAMAAAALVASQGVSDGT